MHNYDSAEFNPQRELPLSFFLDICSQEQHTPSVSRDILWYKNELQAHRHAFRLSSKMKSGEDVTLLEVGSGTGRIGYYLARLPQIKRYIGIDIVADYLAYHKAIDSTADLRQESIFRLAKDIRFDIACMPFASIHLFGPNAQELAIMKLLECHTDTACFDVMFPETFGQQGDFEKMSEIKIGNSTYHARFFARSKSWYSEFAKSLGVNIDIHPYNIKGTNGKETPHSLVTFYR